MGHPYRIRDIAVQAGLSEATVDRVLNERGTVRASTAAEVRQAIADLDRQASQLRLAGRTFIVDVVLQAPERFCVAIEEALLAELPTLQPAVLRSRFHHLTSNDPAEVVAVLERLTPRSTQGVIIKAPDVPTVVAAARRLHRADVPVVTLVTDLPTDARRGYVGIDNRAAGATAAFLVQQWLGDAPGDVLVTRGDSSFRGEDEREIGFRSALRSLAPARRIVEVVESERADLEDRVASALAAHPEVAAIYSMYSYGSGNTATVRAFLAAGRGYRVFVAHDLDADNLSLLHQGSLTVALHHDLRRDLRVACQLIIESQHGLTVAPTGGSAIQVITPYNLPTL